MKNNIDHNIVVEIVNQNYKGKYADEIIKCLESLINLSRVDDDGDILNYALTNLQVDDVNREMEIREIVNILCSQGYIDAIKADDLSKVLNDAYLLTVSRRIPTSEDALQNIIKISNFPETKRRLKDIIDMLFYDE